MKSSARLQFRCLTLAACLTLVADCLAEKFVELSAEIQSENWGYWFQSDERKKSPGHDGNSSIFDNSYSVRCVVGKDAWMMESEAFLQNARKAIWFTGTNWIEHTVITKASSGEDLRRLAKISGAAFEKSVVGQRFTRLRESEDGNPGRPFRVADLMVLREKIPWLAFCSGPVLQREGRKIYPMSDLWKEIGPAEFSDKTEVFEDELGLPQSLELVTPKGQTLMRYQTRQSTNVLGWNFPLEFYLVEYQPARTNGWQVHIIAKGRLTSIKEGSRPEPPDEVMKAN